MCYAIQLSLFRKNTDVISCLLSLLSGGGDGNVYIYDLEESEQDDRRIIKSFASLNG